MLVWNDQRKVRALASDLAEAMQRRYGVEAETLCTEALKRRELIGVRRQITQISLQILQGLSSSKSVEQRLVAARRSGPFSAA